jgi:hypothetical protein
MKKKILPLTKRIKKIENKLVNILQSKKELTLLELQKEVKGLASLETVFEIVSKSKNIGISFDGTVLLLRPDNVKINYTILGNNLTRVAFNGMFGHINGMGSVSGVPVGEDGLINISVIQEPNPGARWSIKVNSVASEHYSIIYEYEPKNLEGHESRQVQIYLS